MLVDIFWSPITNNTERNLWMVPFASVTVRVTNDESMWLICFHIDWKFYSQRPVFNPCNTLTAYLFLLHSIVKQKRHELYWLHCSKLRVKLQKRFFEKYQITALNCILILEFIREYLRKSFNNQLPNHSLELYNNIKGR